MYSRVGTISKNIGPLCQKVVDLCFKQRLIDFFFFFYNKAKQHFSAITVICKVTSTANTVSWQLQTHKGPWDLEEQCRLPLVTSTLNYTEITQQPRPDLSASINLEAPQLRSLLPANAIKHCLLSYTQEGASRELIQTSQTDTERDTDGALLTLLLKNNQFVLLHLTISSLSYCKTPLGLCLIVR